MKHKPYLAAIAAEEDDRHEQFINERCIEVWCRLRRRKLMHFFDDSQPTDETLVNICFPEGDELDTDGALDALATVVDDLVYLKCWDELKAAKSVAKQLALAFHYPEGSDPREERLAEAERQFNRLGAEDLRYLLDVLVKFYVDNDATTELNLLGGYLLNRKVGGQHRLGGDINLALGHERDAERQLDLLMRAAKSVAQ